MRRLAWFPALALAVVASFPVVVFAQDPASSPDLVSLIGMLWPVAKPVLAVVPLVQIAALALSKIPRAFGVTHGTIWERALSGAATFPSLLGFRVPPPQQ